MIKQHKITFFKGIPRSVENLYRQYSDHSRIHLQKSVSPLIFFTAPNDDYRNRLPIIISSFRSSCKCRGQAVRLLFHTNESTWWYSKWLQQKLLHFYSVQFSIHIHIYAINKQTRGTASLSYHSFLSYVWNEKVSRIILLKLSQQSYSIPEPTVALCIEAFKAGYKM